MTTIANLFYQGSVPINVLHLDLKIRIVNL
jgi:hypothetical protein